MIQAKYVRDSPEKREAEPGGTNVGARLFLREQALAIRHLDGRLHVSRKEKQPDGWIQNRVLRPDAKKLHRLHAQADTDRIEIPQRSEVLT